MPGRDKLLIVDDDKLVVAMLSDIFRDSYEIFTAYDGAAALEVLRRQSVRAVLCDQVMPKMTGVDVLKECMTLRPDAVRVLVTASDRIQDLRDAVNMARVHRVIVKPVREVEVKGIVDGALREQVLERENARLVGELRAALAELKEREQELEAELTLRTHELKDVMDQLLKQRP